MAPVFQPNLILVPIENITSKQPIHLHLWIIELKIVILGETKRSGSKYVPTFSNFII